MKSMGLGWYIAFIALVAGIVLTLMGKIPVPTGILICAACLARLC